MAIAGIHLLAVVGVGVAQQSGQPLESVVTVLADFEDDSVAAQIGDVRNVIAADCSARRANIPARATSSLAVEIGATKPQASAACDLLLRVPLRFERADRVATFCWIKTAPARVIFRLRDAKDQIFETAPKSVTDTNRWVYVDAALIPDSLVGPQPGAKMAWPIQIEGYRLEIEQIGRTSIYLDDLQVEHKAPRSESLGGTLAFDKPTKLYQPGETVGAIVLLENRSRQNAVVVSVELAWIRSDGTRLKTEQKSGINLPKSGMDYRASQQIDFSLRINEPGLYRLVARARGVGWTAPAEFQTTIGVTPSNRLLSRGRQTFFGLRSDLLREPIADQMLELDVAREIGAQLLAINAPWSMIQPKPDRLEFETLERVVNAAAAKQMAVLLSLSDVPGWVAENGADLGQAQAFVIAELAKRFGARVRLFEPMAGGSAEQTEGVLRQTAVAAGAVHPDVQIVAPPVRVVSGASGKGANVSVPPAATSAPSGEAPATAGDGTATSMPQSALISRCFETTGDPVNAAAALAEAAKTSGSAWSESQRWQHVAAGESGPGTLYDAESLLRYYVEAARAGVGGVMWFDLRDNDNNTADADAMRGLVARDFSPRNRLLGYASVVGELNGLHYAGAVQGAPAELDSAMFIGADRQVAVLLPRPNRVLPGLLAPVSGIPGVVSVQDFLRVGRPLLSASTPPLIRPMSRPIFVTLKLDVVEPEPQLLFARPWLRIPSCVFVEKTGTFGIELTAPIAIKGGYVRVATPPGCPVESKFGARQLKAAAGETIQQEVGLAATGDGDFERAEIVVQLSLRGSAVEIEVPVEVVRERSLKAIAGGVALASPPYSLAKLKGPEHAGAAVEVAGGYAADQIKFAITVQDRQPEPFQPGVGGQSSGDELLFGLAMEGADRHVEVRIVPSGSTATIVPIYGVAREQIRGWRCTVTEASGLEPRVFELSIPAASLGLERFAAGSRALAAAKYWDQAGATRSEHLWGAGLDGSRSTEGFAWLRLGDGSPK